MRTYATSLTNYPAGKTRLEKIDYVSYKQSMTVGASIRNTGKHVMTLASGSPLWAKPIGKSIHASKIYGATHVRKYSRHNL